MAENESNLIQTVQGIGEIKINNCQTQKRWEWERIQAKLFHISVSSTRLQQYQDAGSLFLNESKNIMITVMAALAVMKGDMTLGMMLAVQYIIGQLNAPVNEFIAFTRDFQDARLSLSSALAKSMRPKRKSPHTIICSELNCPKAKPS